MSQHIYLLRHGLTEAGECYLGRTDATLTELGWQQMQQGLAAYKPAQFEAVISSPLRRCAEFATQWADAEQLQIEPRLAEYDFGQWDGMTGQQVFDAAPRALEMFWKDPWCYPPPAGERLEQFFQRLSGALEDIDAAYDGPVLLICHGGVIRAIRCIMQRQPIARMFNYDVSHGSLHLFRR